MIYWLQCSCTMFGKLLQHHVHNIMPSTWRSIWSLYVWQKWKQSMHERMDGRSLWKRFDTLIKFIIWRRSSFLTQFVGILLTIFSNLSPWMPQGAWIVRKCARWMHVCIFYILSHSFKLHRSNAKPKKIKSFRCQFDTIFFFKFIFALIDLWCGNSIVIVIWLFVSLLILQKLMLTFHENNQFRGVCLQLAR